MNSLSRSGFIDLCTVLVKDQTEVPLFRRKKGGGLLLGRLLVLDQERVVVETKTGYRPKTTWLANDFEPYEIVSADGPKALVHRWETAAKAITQMANCKARILNHVSELPLCRLNTKDVATQGFCPTRTLSKPNGHWWVREWHHQDVVYSPCHGLGLTSSQLRDLAQVCDAFVDRLSREINSIVLAYYGPDKSFVTYKEAEPRICFVLFLLCDQ